LACELDKVFLCYYGSAKGLDILPVLANGRQDSKIQELSSCELKRATIVKGEPLVIADMLTAVWRCREMSHLAGYDQRDAHEFLHGFLEILG
jgi:ubiquitin carboxyl-terminal hydrolase 22/27/51